MNLVFIVGDSIRADYIGIYGNPEIETPTIDYLAKKGVYFKNVIASAPWTLPSVCSYISGIYSHKLGMFDWEQPLPENIKTIFHYFTNQGYTIGSFVFDEGALFSNMPFAGVQGHCRDLNEIRSWINEHYRDKFFLYVHSWWTHIPYEIKESAEAWRKANKELLSKLRTGSKDAVDECKMLYKKSIEHFSEHFVKEILDFLENKNILEDTMIIFTSDHGETWGERLLDRSEITNNFALHGRYLYDESLKVPLVLYSPAVLSEGRCVHSQIRTIDLLPTLIELFKLDSETRSNGYLEMDGKSVLDLIYNESPQSHRIAISSTTDTESEKIIMHQLVKMSVRLPPWKYIWNLTTGEETLFNIKKDPLEKRDVSDKYEDVRMIFKELLEKELNHVPVNNIPPNIRERYIIKRSLSLTIS